MSKGFNFMSQKDYENLLTVPYIYKLGDSYQITLSFEREAQTQLHVLYSLKKWPKDKLAQELHTTLSMSTMGNDTCNNWEW